jgi:hypothetical protein
MMNPPKYARFPATLQASPSIRPEREMSVSEQMRLAREALARPAVRDQLLTSFQPVPVTGQYYDVIRATQQVRTSAPPALTNAFVRGINNKAGGVKSFAAAGYNYPSGQMVIGAALAGMPCPSCGSPSEDRKLQMAGLLGLAGDGSAADLKSVLEQIQAITSLLGSPAPIEVGDRLCNFDVLLDQAIKYLAKNPEGVPSVCSTVEADIDAVLLLDSGSAAAVGRVLRCATVALLQLAPRIAQVCPLKTNAPAERFSEPPANPVVLSDRAKARLRTIRARTAPSRNITLPAARGGRTVLFQPGVNVPPAASSNTMLIVGGIAAAAAAFFLLRKK